MSLRRGGRFVASPNDKTLSILLVQNKPRDHPSGCDALRSGPSTANQVAALEAMLGKVEPIQSIRQSSLPKTRRRGRLKQPWG